MTFNQAKKLHNGDEVTIKETGEVVTVLSAYVENPNNKQVVFIDTCSKDYGFRILSHTEVK